MRLDNYLVKIGIFDSRTKANQAIKKLEIIVNGKIIDKPSFDVLDENADVKHVYNSHFVSLGGYKLEKALKDFSFNVEGATAIDIGASTGGFTDCLLQKGAKKVYAVDLNSELLHHTLKEDDRVSLIVKNVKNLSSKDFGGDDTIDLIVADLSFISSTLVLPLFNNLIDEGKDVILLIKPQFETGEKRRFKNGIIRDKNIQIKACESVYDQAIKNNLAPQMITTAPISKDKNVEFLIWLKKGGEIRLEKEHFKNL